MFVQFSILSAQYRVILSDGKPLRIKKQVAGRYGRVYWRTIARRVEAPIDGKIVDFWNGAKYEAQKVMASPAYQAKLAEAGITI